MRKVLITGASGQLGKQVARQFKNKSRYELILTNSKDLDISNLEKVVLFVKEQNPAIIINCAAYTAVDNCETDLYNAYRVNALGPRNLAIASREINSKIVHVSTDYVFDGEGKQVRGQIKPYTEFDTPNPQTVYGKTKLEGEKFVQRINHRHYILRTAWLYGEGNNFVKTMLKLAKNHQKLTVVNDQYGTPTSTYELAKVILKLIDTDNYGTFHTTCEGECTWFDFAKEIFRLKSVNINVDPVTTEEFPRPAKRPRYSVLENYMLKLTTDYKFSDWKEALAFYLKDN